MTLTETAYWSRATIKYGLFFLIFLVVTRIIWTTGVNIYRRFSPEPPPAPTVSFGKLPPLLFPEGQKPKEGQTLNFTLELPEGDLPKTQAVASVFVVQPKSAYLGALDQAKETVKQLRFKESEEPVTDAIYRFRHESVDSTLDINIVTGAFSISSNLYQDENLAKLTPPSQQVAAGTVHSFLSNADLLPEDFMGGEIKSTYLKNEGGTLVSVISQSEAQFIKIDLFRQGVGNLPVVTSGAAEANVWFIVTGTSEPGKQVIGGEYHYFPVNLENSSTYPLKSSQQAWDDLKAGKGIFVSLLEGQNITVRRVYLAYYDSREFQEYFQPVFVFEGDNGFVGYVPSVTPDYYQ